MMYEGKMNKYDSVVVEMVKPSTKLKSVVILPEPKAVIKIAAIIATLATIPDMVLTAIGVPYLPLNRPSKTGAVRSRAAIAYVRSAPMIQVPPLEANVITKAKAMIHPSTFATAGGSTVATDWNALKKLPTLDS